MTRTPLFACLASCLILTASASAQWSRPTAGIPRLADGKPDVNAPPPRTGDGRVDLSGIWLIMDPPRIPQKVRYFFDLAQDLPAAAVVMTPWAQRIHEQRVRRDHVDDPYGYCMPPGVPRVNTVSAPFKFVHTPGLTAILYETGSAQTFRQVFTDGRPLPEAPEPTWLGYSIGRWEGDEFVVETNGFRDGGWLDTERARPHSDALHVTERFRRPAVGRLEAVITINDPKAFLKPWTVTVPFRLTADTDLQEMTCESHTKTLEHRRIDPPPVEPPSPR